MLRPTPPSPPAGSSNPAPSVRTVIRPDPEKRVLVISKGISITGTITDAERVVVEGTLESPLVQATEFAISPTGVFRGEAEVDEADIGGLAEGVVTARAALQLRSTGKVIGTARYRRLQVEDGGQISGNMEMLADQGATSAPAPAPAPAAPAAAPAPAPASESRPSALPVKPDFNG